MRKFYHSLKRRQINEQGRLVDRRRFHRFYKGQTPISMITHVKAKSKMTF